MKFLDLIKYSVGDRETLDEYGIGMEPELVINLDLSFDSSSFIYRSPKMPFYCFCVLLVGLWLTRKHTHIISLSVKECFNGE